MPSTGPAKALDLENVELLRNVFYDYVRIKDCDTFELYALKAPSWKRHSPRLPRSLTCRVESLTAHVLHVKLLRYDFAVLLDHMVVIPLSSTHGKLYPGSAAPRRLPRSLTCCVPSLTAPAAYQVSRPIKLVDAKNTPFSLFWQSSNSATGPLPRGS